MDHGSGMVEDSQDSTPIATRRADAKARTRLKVLEAARNLFMERGYEAATIRDIASRADLSTGAVFASFTDKADLFNAVMTDDLTAQLVITRRALADDAPFEDALLSLMSAGYEFHLSQLPILLAATSLSWTQGLGGPLGNRPVYAEAMDAMTFLLGRGVKSGELEPSADLALIAETLWSAYLGNYRRAAFDDWGLEQMTARFADQMKLILAGVRTS